MAAWAASHTADTSRPSTSTAGTPNPRARSLRSPPVTLSDWVVMAQPSSLQTNNTGRFQTAARFIDSINMPWFMAPSPKKATATAPGVSIAPPAQNRPRLVLLRRRSRKRRPGALWKTGAYARPCPPHNPSGRPSSSRRIRTGSTPRMSKAAVPRWSRAMASPSRKLGNDAGDDGFFACSQVHLTRDQAIMPQLGDGFFEQAALQHERIERP